MVVHKVWYLLCGGPERCNNGSLRYPRFMYFWWNLKLLCPRKLHQQLVLHMSHLTFMSSCLWNHLILRGLRIKTIPMVPKIDTLQQTLQDQSSTTLNKTSSVLLKHLKGYHWAAIPILEEEISNLKRWLRNNADFAQNLQKIEMETLQWPKICKRKKWKTS